MATYGPNGANGVPFTGFSPTLGGDAITPTTTGNVQFNGLAQTDNRLSALLRARGNRAARRLMLTLFGVAPGATATETSARVQANPALNSITTQGGAVPIEVATVINRATTSTDVSNLQQSISRSSNLTYPTDPSGNGGGGRLYGGIGLLVMAGSAILTIGDTAFRI